MNKWIFSLIQFFPLSLFASYAFGDGPPSNNRWLEAFQFGALIGFLQLVILLPQQRPVNRLILAGNLYLIFGGVAALAQQWWLLNIYNVLRESAIIFLMLGIGIISTFFTQAGFIAAQDLPFNKVRKASYLLLLATIMALPISIIFEGELIFSAVIPIISLAILHRYLIYTASR